MSTPGQPTAGVAVESLAPQNTRQYLPSLGLVVLHALWVGAIITAVVLTWVFRLGSIAILGGLAVFWLPASIPVSAVAGVAAGGLAKLASRGWLRDRFGGQLAPRVVLGAIGGALATTLLLSSFWFSAIGLRAWPGGGWGLGGGWYGGGLGGFAGSEGAGVGHFTLGGLGIWLVQLARSMALPALSGAVGGAVTVWLAGDRAAVLVSAKQDAAIPPTTPPAMPAATPFAMAVAPPLEWQRPRRPMRRRLGGLSALACGLIASIVLAKVTQPRAPDLHSDLQSDRQHSLQPELQPNLQPDRDTNLGSEQIVAVPRPPQATSPDAILGSAQPTGASPSLPYEIELAQTAQLALQQFAGLTVTTEPKLLWVQPLEIRLEPCVANDSDGSTAVSNDAGWVLYTLTGLFSTRDLNTATDNLDFLAITQANEAVAERIVTAWLGEPVGPNAAVEVIHGEYYLATERWPGLLQIHLGFEQGNGQILVQSQCLPALATGELAPGNAAGN